MAHDKSPQRDVDLSGSEDQNLGQKSPDNAMGLRDPSQQEEAQDGADPPPMLPGDNVELRHTDAEDKRSRLADYTIPKRKRKRSPHVQGLSSDSDSDSQSALEYHDDQRVFTRRDSQQQPLWAFAKPKDNVKDSHSVTIDSGTGCFDPLDVSDGTENLTDFQMAYLAKYVTQVGYQPGLAESISKTAPVPPLLTASLTRRVDSEILELLPKGAQIGAKEVDNTLRALGTHTNSLLGPLLSMWSECMSESPSLTDIRTSIEKSIILLGQVNTSSLFHRRKLVLTKFFGDSKKATEVVKRNADTFRQEENQLFGDKFYEALHKKAAGRKHLREARQELGKPYVKRTGHGNPFMRSQPAATFTPTAAAAGAGRGAARPPFRGGPPSRGRGGGRGSKGRGAPRYVAFSSVTSFDDKFVFASGSGKSSVESTCIGVSRGQSREPRPKLGKDYVGPGMVSFVSN